MVDYIVGSCVGYYVLILIESEWIEKISMSALGSWELGNFLGWLQAEKGCWLEKRSESHPVAVGVDLDRVSKCQERRTGIVGYLRRLRPYQ